MDGFNKDLIDAVLQLMESDEGCHADNVELHKLESFGVEVVQDLIALLGHGEIGVQVAAAHALGRLRGSEGFTYVAEAATPALIELSECHEPYVVL
jgi:hypothetical protein